MAWGAENPARRRAVLALVLLGVLLASVALAQWLSSSAQAKIRAGVQIVQEIRSRGLGRFWPESISTEWFILTRGDQPVGWEALIRGGTDEGGFAGLEVRAQQQVVSSQWTLNDDATTGYYWSHLPLGSGGSLLNTEIILADEHVTVLHALDAIGQQRAHAPQPGNYLPEGTMELAVGLVAQKKGDAQFQMVFDLHLNSAGVVDFSAVRLRYAGAARDRQDRPVSKVRMTASTLVNLGPSPRQVELRREYLVDAAGRVVGLEEDDVRWAAATEAEVTQRYPNAPGIVRRLLPEALAPQRQLPAPDALKIAGPKLLRVAEQFLFRGQHLLRQL